MAYLDKFIKALHQVGGERLVITPERRIRLEVAGHSREVSAGVTSREQVELMLRELQSEARGAGDAEGDRRFIYPAPSGAVQVEARGRNGDFRVLLRPVTGTRNANGANGAGAAEVPNGENAAGAKRSAEQGTGPGVGELQTLLARMVEEGCSDLHITAGMPPTYRKDGEIVAVDGAAELSARRTREMLLGIAPARNREEFERRRDTDFACEIPGVARYRCNLFMDRCGVGGVFRMIPARILTVEELGLPEQLLELCRLRKGLVVVTGPTGSGKSTTLAALIDYINRTRRDHIITIEDPIEFVHTPDKCLINQREVGVHTEGFKPALRAALREDPDIVLVGEMRDLETISIALETAETGHLVFGTLHTNTAASTVDRIIDQFPADQQNQIRTLLSESLKGVVAQTLCRKKAGGRVAALETLMVTRAVANLIREGKTYQIPSAMQTGRAAGMRTLNDSLLELVRTGQVEPEEAYSRSVEKDELRGLLGRNGFVLSGNRQTDELD